MKKDLDEWVWIEEKVDSYAKKVVKKYDSLWDAVSLLINGLPNSGEVQNVWRVMDGIGEQNIN